MKMGSSLTAENWRVKCLWRRGTEKEGGERALHFPVCAGGPLDLSFPHVGAGIIWIAAHYGRLKARSMNRLLQLFDWKTSSRVRNEPKVSSAETDLPPSQLQNNGFDWVWLTDSLCVWSRGSVPLTDWLHPLCRWTVKWGSSISRC